MSNKKYPKTNARADFPALEKDILKYWKDNKIFEKSVENRPHGDNGDNEFVFYDGPPFANGMPHYGHLVTGYVKDLVPRYETMKGRRVERRFGWDCHGLPAELSTEKEIGISGRDNIIKYGIEKFNSQCRSGVMKYTKEWEDIVTRQARWVDFEGDYKTMDTPYMESVIWAFKELFEKGLMYEDVRVLPYSWAAETPVSNFETRLDNSYRERIDPAVTVAFTLDPIDSDKAPTKILVWTTTPWTLPSNLAMAVGPDIDYAIMEEEGTHYIICTDSLEKYKKELQNTTQVGTIKGSELVGRTYEPLFPFFEYRKEDSFRILSGDFVTTEDGTGVVHMAPGFGEDDLNICRSEDIKIVCPVDSKGRFTKEVPDFEGLNVFEANKPIIRALKDRGLIIKHEQYAHNYPHCWRTDEPLIYKAINSWFLEVTKIRERMVELNQNITWIPEHIKEGAFGKWIGNARDWSISRNRFWGTPIPVWKSDDPQYPRIDVYGSIEELEKDFGVKVDDLHRPYIDDLVRPNPDDPTGKSTMRRTEDVFDCWFESGSMTFAQVHYPFENKEWFENHFPADFIVEYIAQTRGWFYTLMVLATALFDKHPFKNCICHGVVLDENNQKLSKRLQNYPSPDEVFNTQGADALRWFLISSPILRGGNLAIDREGKEITKSSRKALIPLWNAFHFFCLYANADNIEAKLDASSEYVLDKYILAKLHNMLENVTTLLDGNEIVPACGHVFEFLEVLNNWYIRRSRARFWGSENGKAEAFNTLYTVLITLCKTLAPMLPLVTEHMYRGLTGEESVHLTDWVNAETLPKDDALVESMDAVRSVCSTAKAIREEKSLRNRLPLASLTMAGITGLEEFSDLIKDELNVKEIKEVDNFDEVADKLLYIKTPLVGKRLGKALKDIRGEAAKGNWEAKESGEIEVAGHILFAEEFEERLDPKNGVSGKALPDNTAIIILDTDVTPELEREGIARDFVRVVQEFRKESGLDVSDRINLSFHSDDNNVEAALGENKQYIMDQVLALQMETDAGANMKTENLAKSSVKFALAKAE
ncbi:MAG: isoleucine--tRNA ligase [Alphaproteobacteria bacterium]|nr:isoleucine--tRNA ligase [Alphaproteobacteria bacterium]